MTAEEREAWKRVVRALSENAPINPHATFWGDPEAYRLYLEATTPERT